MNVFDDIAAMAASRPDHPAVIDDAGGRTVSYGDLVASARRLAGRLAEAGVRPAWRVGMIRPQGVSFIETGLGILAAGACMVPIADDHPDATVAEVARRAHLHALLSDRDLSAFPGFAGQAVAAFGGDGGASAGDSGAGAHGITTAAAPATTGLAFTDEATSSLGDAEAAFVATGPAYLRFTSGTTSERKGVVIGHARIAERLVAANEGLGITGDDRVLWLLPMAHHFVVSILLYLTRGATILLPSTSLAPAMLAIAGRERATVLYASPHHMKLLGKDPSAARLDTLRLAVSTAEGLRPEVAEAFRARHGLDVVQALGIMEVGLPVMNLASASTKPDVLGRAQGAYRVWLRADDGSEAAGTGPEASGELCIRGPGMLDAYLDPWTPAAAITEPDGFRTGDQGWFDADGDLHLAGRRAARINMAGMKFFCEEVEAVIDRHPAVERSRVSARQHPHLGELPVAEIVLRPGMEAPTAKELAQFCRASLAGYMVPRSFDVVDSLPMTPTGKLARR